MTKERMEQLAAECQAEVEKELRESYIRDIKNTIVGACDRVARDEADKFAKEVIGPAVREFLATNKDGLIKAACAGAAAIGDQVAAAMVASASKTLGDDWQMRQLLEKLFGR